MPNWCSNVTIARHKDKAKVDALIESLKNDVFFEHILPLGVWEYTKACDTWGTKWEADSLSWMRYDKDGEYEVEIEYQSAWSPPEGVIQKMIQDGWIVTSYYNEPGMAYIGKYTTESVEGHNELADESYNYSEDDIPVELGDMFFYGDYWTEEVFDRGDKFYTLKEETNEQTETEAE